jgi:predicted RNA-binding protein with RPS1 domain
VESNSVVAAGDILDVEVQSVAVFELFCRAGDQEVLVLIPETSWVASYCSCQQFGAVGDRFRVKVLNADAKSGKVSASIKALYPDPWPAGKLAVGTVHQARVIRAIESADRCGDGPGNLLELLPGAFVVLCGESSVVVGQSYSVRVVESDISQHAVRVVLVERPDAEPIAAPGPARE